MQQRAPVSDRHDAACPRSDSVRAHPGCRYLYLCAHHDPSKVLVTVGAAVCSPCGPVRMVFEAAMRRLARSESRAATTPASDCSAGGITAGGDGAPPPQPRTGINRIERMSRFMCNPHKRRKPRNRQLCQVAGLSVAPPEGVKAVGYPLTSGFRFVSLLRLHRL